ncbi:NADH-quinone oxidoreductase subunit C, partial [Escherichia coli]|nr:NADH-quinone oxidoreductase subunit C [Escherichia coli]
VPRNSILDVCLFLKNEHKFDMLADLCGCDRGPEEEPRFEVNYHLFSTSHYNRLRLKVLLSEEDPVVSTVTGVWKTANWHERET